MKKVIVALLFCSVAFGTVLAQDENKDSQKKWFKKENLFTGGSIDLGFQTGYTMLGAIPHIGYSLNKYVDVALSFNVNYVSIRDYQVYGDKVRQTTFAPGAFMRLYPVNFLFAHIQYDRNFLKAKYIYPSSAGQPNETGSLKSNSLLIGGGYCNGRDDESKTFYYMTILFDVGKDKNSPYINYDPVNNETRVVPIMRAGMNIALFQGRYGGRH